MRLRSRRARVGSRDTTCVQTEFRLHEIVRVQSRDVTPAVRYDGNHLQLLPQTWPACRAASAPVRHNTQLDEDAYYDSAHCEVSLFAGNDESSWMRRSAALSVATQTKDPFRAASR